MARRRISKLAVGLGAAIVAVFLALGSEVALAASPERPAGAGAKGQSQSWRDDFGGNQVEGSRWVIANGQAPGYIPNFHLGTYEPAHVSVGGGFLALLLTQEIGEVDGGSGIRSKGALIYTNQTYGYGTYEWRMRMSSTATSPGGDGFPTSGSVSAGFVYVNNSATEIDFEFSGLDFSLETLYMVNWKNSNTSTDPTENDRTFSTMHLPDITSGYHTYKFVWERKRISFYVDDVLQAVHTTHVPRERAYFMINHWGTDSPYWGGTATTGFERYFYVDWVQYTPL